MDTDDSALLALVGAVCDGAHVDWDSASAGASESFKRAIAELRVIAEVANLNRSLVGETGREPESPAPLARRGPQPTIARWGHLHLLEHVASGAFGDVYRAWDPAIDREVALKLLRPRPHRARARASTVDEPVRGEEESTHAVVGSAPGSLTPEWIENGGGDETIEEGRLLARVRHPNVVTVYGAARIEGRVGIWTEFVEGRTLAAVVQHDGPLPDRDLITYGVTLCDAVAAVHRAGLLHRDIKAQNVVLAHDGRIVLMDFGAGRPLNERTRDLAGTPLYLAPEVARGEEATPRSDVYSLGVLLHFLATGTFPRLGLGPRERAQPQRDSGSPAAADGHLSPALEPVVGRAIASEPDRRYGSAQDLGAALKRLVEPGDLPRSLVEPVSSPARALAHRSRWVLGATAVAGLAAAAVGLFGHRGQAAAPSRSPGQHGGQDVAPPRVVQLSNLPGRVDEPSLSPDGDQVAFTWTGERNDVAHVYIASVGTTEVRRLTADLANDYAPSWSPDGRSVTFIGVRAVHERPCIYVVSPAGPREQRICFPGRIEPGSPTWSPDNRSIVVTLSPSEAGDRPRIYLLDVAGGQRRPLISSPEPVDHYNAALSPDGRHLAFVSCKAVWDCGVSIVDVDSTLHVVGPPREAAHISVGVINGPTWTHDSREVIYGTQGVFRSWMHLWRAPIDGSGPPEPIEIAGSNATHPSLAAGRDRLAFATTTDAGGVHRFVPNHEPVLVAANGDSESSFSPDGTHLVFSSSRSGDDRAIWVADSDGSNAHRLTSHRSGQWQGTPSWSPDGRRVAFDERGADGNWHIWTIDAQGGTPQQLTTRPGNESEPSWSHDAKWVYFSGASSAAEDGNVWRIPAAGGTAEQLTHGGGGRAREAPDGRSILYLSPMDQPPLKIAPLTGGSPRVLVPCILGRPFAVGRTDVYYVCGESSPITNPRDDTGVGQSAAAQVLHALNPTTGEDRVIGTLDHAPTTSVLAVSPDEKTILYDRHVELGSNLIMIDNFR